MSKTSYTCTGCIPIDKSIVDAYIALLSADKSVEEAEEARVEAEAGRVEAETARVSAEASRVIAERAREATSSADHTLAASDHTTAVADHATAGGDHTTATSDHTASVEATEAAGVATVRANEAAAAAEHMVDIKTGPQGPQGNTGSSVDYPYELVNNVTTDDATKGLSAAQGVVLDGKISQLGQEVYHPKYIRAITDSEDKILEATRDDGTKEFPTDVEVGGKILLDGNTFQGIDNPEWAQVTTDPEGKIIEGIRKDGKKYIADLYGLPKNVEDIIDGIQGDIDEIRGEITSDTGFISEDIPIPLKFINGYVIVNAGTKSRNAACSYSLPIFVKQGTKIKASVRTNQGIIYKTDADGENCTLLVPSDGVEKQQYGEWIADEDSYVTISGVSGTISATSDFETFFGCIENYYPNTLGFNNNKVLNQETLTTLTQYNEGQDPLQFEEFDLPVQVAENGTDSNGVIDLTTASVQDVYDIYDALIARSNGYITKEILGKDESGLYDVWRLTACNTYLPIVNRLNGDATENRAIYKRKVVIDANVHGAPADPKDATMTVYNLLRFLIDYYPTNPVAKWLRETYQFIIIPILNPWGFDHEEDKNGVNHSGYGNYNGVNCNDNYPTDDFIPNYTHASIYNCSIGPYPASEKETQYIINTLKSHKDIFAWLDIHSYGPYNGRHASYCVEDDYLHPYNPKRMLQVIEHAARKVTPEYNDYWFDGLDERGWSPRYGSCYLGVWCPHMEMACRVGSSGEEYSSAALTSDLYYLVGQLMFK